MTQHLNFSVISEPEPNTRVVMIVPEGEHGTIIVNAEDADVTFHCGSCGKPIVVGWHPSQMQNIVFKCNGCGAHNETVE